MSKPSRLLTEALEGDWQDVHKRLRELLHSDDEKVAIEATKFYVDHIKGKAKQTVAGDAENPLRIDMGMVDMLRKLVAP